MSQKTITTLLKDKILVDEESQNLFAKGLVNLLAIVGIPDDIRNLTHNIDVLKGLFDSVPAHIAPNDVLYSLNAVHKLIHQQFGKRYDCFGHFKLHQPSQKSHIPKNEFPLYLAIDNLRRHHNSLKETIVFSIIVLNLCGKPFSKSVTRSILIDSHYFAEEGISAVAGESLLSRLKKTIEAIKNGMLIVENSAVVNLLNSASALIEKQKEAEKNHEAPPQKINVSPNIPSNEQSLKDKIQKLKAAQKLSKHVFNINSKSTKVRPIPNTDDLLVAESVFEDAPDIEIHPVEKIENQPISIKRAKKAASEKRFRDAMTAQFLKSDRKRLTELELNRICDHAIAQLEAPGKHQGIAFGVLLTLTTGAEPLYWCSWGFEPNTDEPYIDIVQGIIFHYAQADGGFWSPTDAQQSKLVPTNERIALPIELRLLNYLKGLGITSGQTLSDALGLTGDELDQACTEWVKSLFSDSSRWFTITRVRYFLYQNIMTQTLDETLASHIAVQPAYKIPASNSYTAVSQQYLYDTFCNALPKTLRFAKPTTPNQLAGSKLQIRVDFLQAFLNERRQLYNDAYAALTHRATLTEIINLHNLFVDYAVLVGFIHTSHRPQEDPWARPTDFLTQLHAVLITDKVTGVHNVTRLSYFGSDFHQLIDNYHQHLKNLAYWLTHFELPIEALRVSSLLSGPSEHSFSPFFFYLEQSKTALRFVSISSGQLDQRMPDFGLPWNFGRHLRASYFRAHAVPAEYISYDFGHVGIGQQPFGDYSALKPADIEAVIKPVVDVLSAELNIETLPPMPFKQSKLALPNQNLLTPAHAIILGYQKRQQKREQKAKGDHDIIRCIQQRYFEDDNFDSLTQSDLEKALDDIYTRSPIHLVKTLNLFSRLCTSFIKKHELDLSPPARLIELKSEVSSFTQLSGNLIAQGNALKHQLPNRLDSYSRGGNNQKQLMDALAKLVITLHLYSFLSCKKTLAPLLIAIKCNDYLWFNQRLHINLRHKGRVYRRIPIDHFSAALVAQIKGLVKSSTPTKRFLLEDIEPALLLMTQQLFGKALTIKDLAGVSDELAKVELPGYLRAVQTGARRYASLDEVAWLRLHQNIRVARPIIEKDSTELHTVAPRQKSISQTIQHYKAPSHIDLSLAKAQRRRMTRVLREGIQSSRVINLEKLGHLLEEFRNEQALLITLLLNQWLMDTISRPGKRVSKLSYSTITSEFSLVARHLTESFATQNIFESSTNDRLEVYQSIVFLDENSQGERKSALINFDSFLARQHKLKPIVPSTLEAQLLDDPLSVDANFINEQEYQKIKQVLVAPFEEHHLETQMIFILYYRLGMRPGEIYKYSFKDVQLGKTKNDSYIINKFNHLGRLKNSASVRLISFDLLLDDEFEVFKDWFKEAQSKTKSLTQSIWKVDQQLASKKINDALKTVTGDTDLTIRNLRHGVVSQLMKNMQLSQQNQNGWQDLLKRQFTTTHPTRRSIYQIARIVGHGGPSTTTFNYANWYEPLIDATLPLPVLKQYTFFSETLKKSPSLIRQWVKRSESDEPIRAILTKYFKEEASLKSLVTQFKNAEAEPEQVNPLLDLHHDLMHFFEPQKFKLLNQLNPNQFNAFEQEVFKLVLSKGFDPYQIAAHKIRTQGLLLKPVEADIDPSHPEIQAWIVKYYQQAQHLSLEKIQQAGSVYTTIVADFYLKHIEDADLLGEIFSPIFHIKRRSLTPVEGRSELLQQEVHISKTFSFESITTQIHPRFEAYQIALDFSSAEGKDTNHLVSLLLMLTQILTFVRKSSFFGVKSGIN